MTATAALAAAAPQLPPAHAPAPPAPGIRRRQQVRTPWSLVSSEHYTDAALAVYLKVAALAQRPEGCTAGVAVLATYLGMSKSAVERGLRQLTQPDPETGVAETTSTRRTLPGGRGHTALRTVRPIAADELYVWLPVGAADTLTPRQLRAYAVLVYCEARGIPLTAAELAEYLRHHSGPRKGEPVDERSARAVINELDALGWITVARRAGLGGRHTITCHRFPLHPLPQQAAVPAPTGPEAHDGSGPDLGDGPLTYKEDPTTDRPEKPTAVVPSAVGEVQVRTAAQPVDNSQRRDGGPHLGYAGPPLTISPRIWHVLDAVRPQYTAATVWEQRAVARQIGNQLDAGCDLERLRLRLQERRARTHTEDITNPGRWLLGAALPRWGCPNSDCESGVLWSTSRLCEVCDELRQDRRTEAAPAASCSPRSAPAPATAPAPVWHECDDCGAPSRTPFTGGLCRDCTPPDPDPERSTTVLLPPSARTPCSRCARPIIWTITDAGRRQAVDPTPDERGNTVVHRDATSTIRSRRPSDDAPRMPWDHLYIPHAATCGQQAPTTTQQEAAGDPVTDAPAPQLPPVASFASYRARKGQS